MDILIEETNVTEAGPYIKSNTSGFGLRFANNLGSLALRIHTSSKIVIYKILLSTTYAYLRLNASTYAPICLKYLTPSIIGFEIFEIPTSTNILSSSLYTVASSLERLWIRMTPLPSETDCLDAAVSRVML
jgi:hypothetical protein